MKLEYYSRLHFNITLFHKFSFERLATDDFYLAIVTSATTALICFISPFFNARSFVHVTAQCDNLLNLDRALALIQTKSISIPSA